MRTGLHSPTRTLGHYWDTTNPRVIVEPCSHISSNPRHVLILSARWQSGSDIGYGWKGQSRRSRGKEGPIADHGYEAGWGTIFSFPIRSRARFANWGAAPPPARARMPSSWEATGASPPLPARNPRFPLLAPRNRRLTRGRLPQRRCGGRLRC